MKVYITGGTGFVGKNILRWLFDLGYEVDLITSNQFRHEDWSLLDNAPDAVIHCAWPTTKPIHSIEHLEFAEWSCNFLDICKKRGIRVINIGSSSEYGVKHKPMKEDMSCFPINTYGIAKLSVTLYAKNLGFNTLRLFSPAGEGGKNFLSMKEKAEKYGNPKDNRDYQHVVMVCKAVERLLHATHLYGEIINVCTGLNMSHGDIYTQTTGKKVDDCDKWFKYPQNQYEPQLWVGDPSKMRRLLNV